MASPPPALDPPFRGYIETTFDALLVFEAARRGMIPRVTRRLIERERGMVQSGAVFVFDEHESGIKRWTDGLVWSPSRILGNFLVYRETDKKSNQPPTPISTSGHPSSPNQTSPTQDQMGRPGTSSAMQPPHHDYNAAFGHGALARPRSASDSGGHDRQRERQLVGSLVNSSKFKDGGLVKKTMSVTVNGYAQHMISYYTMEEVMDGKLRSPSTIPELASLEISPEYLHKQNFRFPPMIEVGQDGIPRYRGEPEEPMSPQSPMSGISGHSFPQSPHGPGTGELYDPYGHAFNQPQNQAMRMHASPDQRHRSVTVPMPLPLSSPYISPGPSSGPNTYFDNVPPLHQAGQGTTGHMPGIVRQNSNSSLASSSGVLRPGSAPRRYDPYSPASTSPRTSTAGSLHARRTSQPMIVPGYGDYHPPPSPYDVKPQLSPDMHHQDDPHYHYPPPSTAASFSEFGAFAPQPTATAYGPNYSTWTQPSPTGRMQHGPNRHLIDITDPVPPHSPNHAHPPTAFEGMTAGSGPAASGTGGEWTQGTTAQSWEGNYGLTAAPEDWRGQGTSVG